MVFSSLLHLNWRKRGQLEAIAVTVANHLLHGCVIHFLLLYERNIKLLEIWNSLLFFVYLIFFAVAHALNSSCITKRSIRIPLKQLHIDNENLFIAIAECLLHTENLQWAAAAACCTWNLFIFEFYQRENSSTQRTWTRRWRRRQRRRKEKNFVQNSTNVKFNVMDFGKSFALADENYFETMKLLFHLYCLFKFTSFVSPFFFLSLLFFFFRCHQSENNIFK